MKVRTEQGAAVVEFAVILPLLLLLVFGIIEFGLLIYNKAMITNASREGARIGIVYRLDRSTADADITNTVDNYLSNYLITFGGTGVHTTQPNPSPTTSLTHGDTLTVTVTYDYHFLVVPAFITNLVGGVQITGVTSMRAE